jgi:hypothetical protein
MVKSSVRVLAVAAVLAVPAHAAAGPSPAEVLAADLARSTAALGRAGQFIAATDETRPTISTTTPAFTRRRAAALRQLSESRRAFGKAKSQAVRILRTSKTRRDRTAAAQALGMVAAVQEQTIPPVLDLLAPAAGAAERSLGTALLDLTVGRDQAVQIINSLVNAGVTPGSLAKLTQQLVDLTTGRLQGVNDIIAALQNSAVSPATKSSLVRSLDASLAGQALSALGLKGLTDLIQLPAAVEKALSDGLGAVPGELTSAANALSGVVSLLPPGLADFVNSIVQRALAATQILLPAPAAPAGPATPATPEVGTPDIPASLLLPGNLPLPVDPLNVFNLLPGLGASCNLGGFLPSFLPFNPFSFLSQLPGVGGLFGGCQ